MALHEKLKNAKIVEDISGYLLDKGYKHISLEIDILDHETRFTITVKSIGEDLIALFEKDLYCCREIELEEYGLDQIHDQDCACTLKTLGMLVDSYDIELENDVYHIAFHRMNQ